VRSLAADKIFLPARIFSSAESIFVKVVSKRGFFDHSGWCPMVLTTPGREPAKRAGGKSKGVEPRVVAVVPCYNLAEICGPIVRATAGFADRVIAVNDGSEDATESVLRSVAAECPNVEILSLPKN